MVESSVLIVVHRRFQKPPGTISSSFLGLEAMTGALDDFGFEDYLNVEFEPRGNYASESYFKKVLLKSHFITEDPSEANLFFLPFSIDRLKHYPRVGINGIQDFIKNYIYNISHEYSYWNRSGGSDHFYVACHSIGRFAVNKAIELKLNAIQVVCSSSYYVSAYVAHKDASLPQIWPRHENITNLASQKREKLAFFAGSLNSPICQKLVQLWGNDTEISVNAGNLERNYTEELPGSKFCLHEILGSKYTRILSYKQQRRLQLYTYCCSKRLSKLSLALIES